MSIKIKNINYNNTKDIRLLETVLTNWFNNPKELNLIDQNQFAFCWIVDYPMFEEDEHT